jgi:glycosyltransferase involved in cell wall biosynthesis
MEDGARQAIELLGRRRRVELVCVYNVEASGQAVRGLPDPVIVHVRHVQLEVEPMPGSTVSPTVVEEMARADIGLVPNLLPVRHRRRALGLTASREPWLLYEPFDYLLRFKASSNPGRLYPFARLGVPVVADVTPSLAQFVLDGVSGMLVASPEGWLQALERLADEPELRTSMAAELRARLDAAYDRQVSDLLAFLDRPSPGPPPRFSGRRSAEDDLGDRGGYASPGRTGLAGRLRMVVRRRRP